MGIEKLTERQVIGEFYKALTQNDGAGWINMVSNYFTSDQSSEEYAWLGQSPVMREWIGGRNVKGFSEQSMSIRNVHYEATMEVLVRDLRRDKSGQVMVRIAELARRSQAHWASLLSTLLLAGASTACYDGQYFFSTTHSEGSSGNQSNSISVDISELPVATNGIITAPAVAEMQQCIVQAVAQIVGFLDNQAQPMNEDASSFLVMTPLSLWNAAAQAVATPVQVAETQTALEALKQNFSIQVVPNARLSTWTANFVVFRTDSAIKSFIRQEEQAVQLKVKGEGSEYEFDNDAHQYGIDSWRNVGYGYWQNSCLVTMT